MKMIVKVTLIFKQGKKTRTVETQVNSPNTANKLINSVKKKLPPKGGIAMKARCEGIKVYSKKDIDMTLREIYFPAD